MKPKRIRKKNGSLIVTKQMMINAVRHWAKDAHHLSIKLSAAKTRIRELEKQLEEARV